ncbi:response regulator [Paenibacillus faecalis]|uniref:response regulator n=1 Tax=Paenibacillus faecalis TaxID=2079532 RepID=UPI000D108ED3|nr:response regulator [Paenibacillus faecalis]
MYKLLLVDDERFQRAGIKFIIEKYKLNLDVIEAGSGEKAWSYLQNHHVDILLTDIRMKEMSGLQLAERVRALDKRIKVIFMSAYGEFEYAQQAIDLKAIKYILKPVEVSEFLKVLSMVIEICDHEQRAREETDRMQRIYGKGIRYEQQKLISQLVHGHNSESIDQMIDISTIMCFFSNYDHFRMVILDCSERFFDQIDEDFERELSDQMQRQIDMIDLNEHQCLLFMEAFEEESKSDLEALGSRLITWSYEQFGIDLYVAFSGTIQQASQIREAYNEFEMLLESKFFYNQGVVFFTGAVSLHDQEEINVEEMLQEINRDVDRKDYSAVRVHFERLAILLQANEQVSSIYLKYICMEIVKKLITSSPNRNSANFKKNLELVYNTNRLNDLIALMISILEENECSGKAGDDSKRKVIAEVIHMIETEYYRDISVEEIAERVYLSPNYLSHLFKKQAGVSIIKYITSVRMERAKDLLQNTNKKIADISEETGYRNVAYFCSLFKTYFGIAPTQFREESKA